MVTYSIIHKRVFTPLRELSTMIDSLYHSGRNISERCENSFVNYGIHYQKHCYSFIDMSNTYQIMYRETLNFQCQLLQYGSKNWFSDRAFYFTITNADIRNLKFRHKLLDKHLNHILVKKKTKIVWYKIYRILSFLGKKWSTIFEKVLTSF